MSRDPAGLVDGPNLYAYVGNRPTYAFDPYGEFSLQDVKTTLNVAQNFVMLTPALAKRAAQNAVLKAITKIADVGNERSGGEWSKPADDKDVTAYQLFYQWVHGTGTDSRTFDENSVMGSQILQADFLQSKLQLAAQRALQGDFAADKSTAVSGTRLSATAGGYKLQNPTAVFTTENPYGPNGPLRTIDIRYNLHTFVVLPNP